MATVFTVVEKIDNNKFVIFDMRFGGICCASIPTLDKLIKSGWQIGGINPYRGRLNSLYITPSAEMKNLVDSANLTCDMKFKSEETIRQGIKPIYKKVTERQTLPTKVYVATLDRFGYEMRTVATTEKQARENIVKAYITAYKNTNGIDPRQSTYGKEDYKTAKEEIYVDEYNLAENEVHWG